MADTDKRVAFPSGASNALLERGRARHALRELMAFVDKVPDSGLDWWPVFIQHVAATFQASACLIWHEFGHAQRGELVLAVPYSQESAQKYRSLSRFCPWLQFMWSREKGFFIDGEEHNPLSRTDSSEADKKNFQKFFKGWMKPQNLIRGLGGVLLKEKPVAPGWAVGAGILRPDGERGIGLYTKEEKEEFQSLIPFMLKHIGSCQAINEYISLYKKRNLKYNSVQHTKQLMLSPNYTPDDLIRELLELKGIAEQNRPGLANFVARVLEDAYRNPEAFNAAHPAMTAMLEAVQAAHRPSRPPEAASALWQERVAPKVQASASPPPDRLPETRGRKRKDPPPTPEEVREARRLISWQSRHKDEPLDPDVMRKARRDLKWAERNKRRQGISTDGTSLS